jgi:hypothetical protein
MRIDQAAKMAAVLLPTLGHRRESDIKRHHDAAQSARSVQKVVVRLSGGAIVYCRYYISAAASNCSVTACGTCTSMYRATGIKAAP